MAGKDPIPVELGIRKHRPVTSRIVPDDDYCRCADPGNVGGTLGIDGLSHLAGLQAIAAIQGAANLASTGSLSGVDLLAIGKQVRVS